MELRNILFNDNKAMAAIIRRSLEEFNAAKPGTVYFDKTTDCLSDIFITPRSAYYVIEINGEIVGGAGYFPTKGLPENVCELVKLYVAKKFRSNGYGHMLLEKCIQDAKKDGFKKMYIESMPELVNAISMYEKNGFYFMDHSLGNSSHSGCDVWMLKDL